ncbi:MAG: amidohydrolase [Chloroflexi bacterium]|nr:amidohydrolase [Chloroflexota bacterium]
MAVDFHTHLFPPWVQERHSELLKRDATFVALYSDPKASLATAEELIESMDRAGVEKSVALNIGWVEHALCVETNDYLLEAAARYPHRLVPFCAVQPRAGEAAINELARCAKGGARGLGELRPDVQGYSLKDEALLTPLVSEAMRWGLIFLIHASEPVGHHYPGKGTITPDQLYAFCRLYPDLPLVAAHWGGGLPFYSLMPEVAQALKNVYFDTAASHLLYRPQIYSLVTSLVGPDKVLFGSDYPLISQAEALGRVRELGLEKEIEDLLLGGNARRLLEKR